MLSFRKNQSANPKKTSGRKDRRTERWKDRQILIHRTLVATAGSLKKAPPYPEFQVSKKNIYLFQIFHCIHSLWSHFLRKLKCREKIFVYLICSSQHNKEKCNKIKEINILCGYCRYKFDIWYFDLHLNTIHWKDYINFITEIRLIFNSILYSHNLFLKHCRFTGGSRKQPFEPIKWFTTEPPHCMSHHTINHHSS